MLVLSEKETEKVKHSYIFPGVYFHGQALDLKGYDLVYGIFELPFNLHEGVHKVDSLKDEKLLLYFWYDRNGNRHGLIVLKEDTKSRKYARKKLKNRAKFL